MQAQTRRWVLFFLCFILIFVGYTWLRNHLWPPPKPLSPEACADVEVASRVIANSMPGGDLGEAVRLAAAVNFNRDDEHKLALALWQDREEKKKQAAAKPPEPVKPAVPAKPAERIAFGAGEGYYLRGEFINRGAGVDKLTLVPFNAADWFGRPARDEEKKPLPLELIHPAATPAFALFHYADENDERPLDTLGTRDWQVVEKNLDGDEQRVAFATELQEFGVRIVKTFTLRPREYHLGLTVRVERLPGGKESKKLRYQIAGVGTPDPVDLKLPEGERLQLSNKRSMPIEGGWYTTVNRNAVFDWVGADGVDKRNLFDSRSIAHTSGSDEVKRTGPSLQFAAVANQYFTSAIVVAEDQPKRDFIERVRATLEGEVAPSHPQLADITVRAVTEPLEPKAGEPIEHKFVLYHGPVKVSLLEKLSGEGSISAELTDRYANKLHLHTLTDYGIFSGGYFHFWTDAIIFFTNAVHWLIGVFRYIVPNFPGRDAICIILVTVLVRLLMMPLSRRQQGSMARTQEAMAKLKPEIAKLNEKYKNDLLAKQQAQMELYRKHGVNPAAGLGGCLLLFVQMPIFLGLYFALQESFFFRLEPFLWIRNLTAPDMLFWWSEKIPFISEPASLGSFFYLGPYFNLLPVLAITLMALQMKWSQPPAIDDQTAQQQKMMQYIMVPMFALMFFKWPAGLCLYFTATTLWGMAERKWLIKKKPAGTAPADKDNGKPGARGGRYVGAPGGKDKRKDQSPPGRIRAWWQRMRERWERLLEEASKK